MYDQLYASRYVKKDYEKRVQEVVSLMRQRYGVAERRTKTARIASSKTSKKTCYDRRPRHQRVDLDVLVQRVRAVADRAEAVERRHTEGGGEVAVRAAAGAALLERDADLRRARSAPSRTT